MFDFELALKDLNSSIRPLKYQGNVKVACSCLYLPNCGPQNGHTHVKFIPRLDLGLDKVTIIIAQVFAD